MSKKRKSFLKTAALLLSIVTVLFVGQIVPPMGISSAASGQVFHTGTTVGENIKIAEAVSTQTNTNSTTAYDTVTASVYQPGTSVSRSVYEPLSPRPPSNNSMFPMRFNGKNVVREVVEIRDQYSKHFQLEDGSYEAVISMGSVHYQDEYGEWWDINTDLTDEADIDVIQVPLSKEAAIVKL